MDCCSLCQKQALISKKIFVYYKNKKKIKTKKGYLINSKLSRIKLEWIERTDAVVFIGESDFETSRR